MSLFGKKTSSPPRVGARYSIQVVYDSNVISTKLTELISEITKGKVILSPQDYFLDTIMYRYECDDLSNLIQNYQRARIERMLRDTGIDDDLNAMKSVELFNGYVGELEAKLVCAKAPSIDIGRVFHNGFSFNLDVRFNISDLNLPMENEQIYGSTKYYGPNVFHVIGALDMYFTEQKQSLLQSKENIERELSNRMSDATKGIVKIEVVSETVLIDVNHNGIIVQYSYRPLYLGTDFC